jgi:hypothetical protein
MQRRGGRAGAGRRSMPDGGARGPSGPGGGAHTKAVRAAPDAARVAEVRSGAGGQPRSRPRARSAYDTRLRWGPPAIAASGGMREGVWRSRRPERAGSWPPSKAVTRCHYSSDGPQEGRGAVFAFSAGCREPCGLRVFFVVACFPQGTGGKGPQGAAESPRVQLAGGVRPCFSHDACQRSGLCLWRESMSAEYIILQGGVGSAWSLPGVSALFAGEEAEVFWVANSIQIRGTWSAASSFPSAPRLAGSWIKDHSPSEYKNRCGLPERRVFFCG